MERTAPPASRRPSLFVRLLCAIGLGRGMFRQPGLGVRPAVPLRLYSAEACPACRRVRQTLTELDLDYLHLSCPRGDSDNRRELRARGGKIQIPYLVDPNTGVEMYESRAIVRYLHAHYGPAATSPSLPTPRPAGPQLA